MSGQPPEGARGRVVLVDHRRFVREALAALLRRADYDVVAVSDDMESIDDVGAGLHERDTVLVGPGVAGRSSTTHRYRLLALPSSLEALMQALQGDDAAADTGCGSEHERSDRRLSEREVQVLKEIARGGGSREVGVRLGIQAKTVENHKASIFAKLGVQSQAQAVAEAARGGLLDKGVT